jgi:hypothetical protein
MKEKVEIWLTVNCTKPIKDVLLNRGIAMGNEFRFDRVSWKVIVTRTADVFLDCLKRAVTHRITQQFADVQPAWRTALGDDELLIVPPTQDRQAAMPQIRQVMAFLRELLYERKFVGTVLRAVLMEIVSSRSEERILAGKFDTADAIARVVDRLNVMDLTKEGLGAEQASAAAASEPALRIAAPAPPEPQEQGPAAEGGEKPAAEGQATEPPAEEEKPADQEPGEDKGQPEGPEDDKPRKPKRGGK